MFRWSPFLLAAALVSLLLTAESAHAARSARLVYVRGPGAETCPDEDAVRAAVAARLGYDPFVAYAATILMAHIRRYETGFRTEVKLVDENGVERGARQMTTASPRCADAISAMALTVSLAIDPLSLTGPLKAPTEPAPTRPPERPPPKPEAREPPEQSPEAKEVTKEESEKEPPEPFRLFQGLGVLGSLGLARVVAPGATVFVGARWRAISLAIEGRAELHAAAAPSQPDEEPNTALMGQLVPCVHLRVPYACAVLAMGSMPPSTIDVETGRKSGLYAGLGARLGVALPITTVLEARIYTNVLASLKRRFPMVSADLNFALAVRF